MRIPDFFWFSHDEWSRIEPLLPVNGKGARRVDDRRVLSGIVHALQSGGRWGDCPPVYVPKKTLYNRFVRWADRGVWEGIFSALADADGVQDRLFIDRRCIKAHQTAGGTKRGGLGQWYRPDTQRQKLQGPRHLVAQISPDPSRRHLFCLAAPDRAMSMNIRSVIAIGLVMRLLWAGYIAHLGVEAGLGPDAQIFYGRMIDVVRTGSYEPIGTGGPLVVNLTAFVMMPFGDVLLIACILSCAVWWIAGRLFVASLELLQLSYRQKLWATLLFAFWPTAIPYTSNPLRESFQLCFVSLAVFGALYLLINRRLVSWALVIAGSFLAGLLHGALAAFGLAALGLTALFFSLTSGKKFPVVLFLIGSVVAGGILYSSEQIISSSFYDLSGGTLTSIQSYQEGGVSSGGRAAYKQEVGNLDLLNALVALPIGFFQYLFEPFPQRISTLADLVLALENLLRLIILLSIPASFRKLTDPIARRVLLYLLALYVAQEFIWSVGTINWGTASRHHVPAMGLLMLVAAHLRIFQPVSQRAPRRPRPLPRRSIRL